MLIVQRNNMIPRVFFIFFKPQRNTAMGYCVDSLSNLLLHKTQHFLSDVFTAKSPQQHDR